MFQLSKKVEYGLIAIRHMASAHRGEIFSAKEIADKYQLPYDLLAKIMQKLAKKGYIGSYHGMKGGYTLLRNPEDLKVSEIIYAIEGKPSVNIVQCEASSAHTCTIHDTCTIKDPLVKLQSNINKVLSEITVLEMFQ